MRLVALLLLSLLLVACGPSKKEQLLDRTFQNAQAQAVGQLHAIEQLTRFPDFKSLPKPKIKPAQIPDYLPIIADQPPQSWSVLMRYGPGENQITVEAFGDSTNQPLKSKIVGPATPTQ